MQLTTSPWSRCSPFGTTTKPVNWQIPGPLLKAGVTAAVPDLRFDGPDPFAPQCTPPPRFGDVQFRFPDGIVWGVARTSEGTLELNPRSSYVVGIFRLTGLPTCAVHVLLHWDVGCAELSSLPSR